jgi:hypothetical protein
VEQRSSKLSKRTVDGLWDLFVRVRYPKMLLLAITAFLAYGLFQMQSVQEYFHGLNEFGYASAFGGGMLFAVGFGAPFGVAILGTIADDVNILIAAAVGGLGALLSDYIIFRFIKVTFNDEIMRFRSSKAYRLFDGYLIKRMPPKIAFYLAIGIAGFMIASPLPDEIGVAMFAGLTTVRERTFAVIAFTLNTIGILAVLGIGLAV